MLHGPLSGTGSRIAHGGDNVKARSKMSIDLFHVIEVVERITLGPLDDQSTRVKTDIAYDLSGDVKWDWESHVCAHVKKSQDLGWFRVARKLAGRKDQEAIGVGPQGGAKEIGFRTRRIQPREVCGRVLIVQAATWLALVVVPLSNMIVVTCLLRGSKLMSINSSNFPMG